MGCDIVKPRFVVGNLIGPITPSRAREMSLEKYYYCLTVAAETRNGTPCYRLVLPAGKFIWHTAGFIDEHFELASAK